LSRAIDRVDFGKERSGISELSPCSSPCEGCSDLNPDCSFEARGNTDEDVLKKVAEHAKTIHKTNKILPDVPVKPRSAIRNEGKARAQKAGS
jgi:predicted small metal-binding protein